MTHAVRCALVALVVVSAPLGAQRRSAYWLALGAGPGYLGGTGSIALYADYNYQRGANLFTVRGTGVVDVLGALVDVLTGRREKTGASEIGLLYGRARRPGHVSFAVSAGIGVAQVTHDSAGTSHRTYHPSLPMEAQLGWRPVPAVGLVIIGFASLNEGQSFSGLVGGVQLGRLF